MRRVLRMLLPLLATLAATTAGAAACREKVTTPLQSVVLFRVFDIWQRDPVPPPTSCWPYGSSACRNYPVSRIVNVLEVFKDPGDTQPSGWLVMHLVPGADYGGAWEYGFSFARAGEDTATRVEPDIPVSYVEMPTDERFAGGFAQTLLARRGDWYRITLPYPMPDTAWVKLDRPRVLKLKRGDEAVPVGHIPGVDPTWQGGNVSSIGKGSLRVGPSVALGPEDPKPPPMTLPIAGLYNDRCRLMLAPSPGD